MPSGSSPVVPSNQVLFNRISLAADTSVAGASWGIMISLYTVCMYTLLRDICSTGTTRNAILFSTWITMLWTPSSISTIANAYCTLYAYSWKMDYPGGPQGYLNDSWDKPIPLLVSVTYILTLWVSDLLMVWRVVVFYDDVHPLVRSLILSFASLLYMGTGSLMITVLATNQTMDSERAMSAGISLFTLSVTLNVFVMAVIVIRLLCFKKLLERALGSEQARASPYTSVAVMLIESSALYAIWSLVFIVLYAMNNVARGLLLDTHRNIQVIAPMLIIHRVSKGINWERMTSNRLVSDRMLFAEVGTTLHSPERQQETLASNVKVQS